MKKLLFTLLVLLAVMLPVMAFAEAPVVLANVDMFPGNYLANGADAVSSTQPAGGYAYLSEDGKTLTFHNYDNMDKYCSSSWNPVMIVNAPLTVNMEGVNTLSSWYPSRFAILQKTALTFQGKGKLTVCAEEYGIRGQTAQPLTFAEGTVEFTEAFAYGINGNQPVILSGGNMVFDVANCAIHVANRITISDGCLTVRDTLSGIVGQGITVSGGKVDIDTKSECMCVLDDDLVISGGDIRLKTRNSDDNWGTETGIWTTNAKVLISGGRLDISNADVGITADNVCITGGDITMNYRGYAIEAWKSIQCGLPLPEGVEIRKSKDFANHMEDVYCLDFTDHFDRENDPNYTPGMRTIHLFAPAVPTTGDNANAVPTTGDNANIAMWAALAVMSAAAMLVIRRKRTV